MAMAIAVDCTCAQHCVGAPPRELGLRDGDVLDWLEEQVGGGAAEDAASGQPEVDPADEEATCAHPQPRPLPRRTIWREKPWAQVARFKLKRSSRKIADLRLRTRMTIDASG